MLVIWFRHTLGFDYDVNTLYVLLAKMHLLESLSKERIYMELKKMNNKLAHFNAYILVSLDLIDLISAFAVIFGSDFSKMLSYNQNSKYHKYTLDIHSVHTYMYAANEQFKDTPTLSVHVVKMAAILHDIGKPNVATINEKTGFTNYINHAKESSKLAKNILTDFETGDTIRENKPSKDNEDFQYSPSTRPSPPPSNNSEPSTGNNPEDFGMPKNVQTSFDMDRFFNRHAKTPLNDNIIVRKG
jgi:hypothetical protein